MRLIGKDINPIIESNIRSNNLFSLNRRTDKNTAYYTVDTTVIPYVRGSSFRFNSLKEANNAMNILSESTRRDGYILEENNIKVEPLKASKRVFKDYVERVGEDAVTLPDNESVSNLIGNIKLKRPSIRALFDNANKIPDKYRAAIRSYTDDLYQPINEVSSGASYSANNTISKEYAKELSDDIEKGLTYSKLMSPLSVFHGMNEFDVTKMKNLEPGKVVSFNSFLSSSLNPEVADGFSNGDETGKSEIMLIDLPEGTEAAYISGLGMASGGRESELEVLVNRNQKFKFIGKTVNKDANIYHLKKVE